MKLGKKLLFPIVATAIVATTGGLINGMVAQHNAVESARLAEQSLAQQRAVAGARERMGLMHAGTYRTLVLMASLDESAVKTVRESLPRQSADIQQVTAEVARHYPQAGALADRAAAVSHALAAYVKSADEAIDLASVDPNTGVAAMQSADAEFTSAGQAMAELVAGLQQLNQQAQASDAARTWQTTLWLSVASVLVTALVVLGCARMLKRVASSLRDASLVAEAVAAGDLTPRAVVDRADEIGDLQHSLSRMVDQLRLTLSSVRDAARGTALASSEIASGNHELSDRTEQTAARLQQAATSMADLSAAVGQAAEAAAQASGLASDTSAAAERSGATVECIVENMDAISASSRKISDIIGVIDGIAFQTNLLALNAAVEAARAGEQGRGFAVVAGEVRGLAKRSAEAAKEIKTLIDQSVETVAHGTRLVKEAGGTMGDLVLSVRQVNHIIGEISARAARQRHDLEQVHDAVDQLDQMTQQNAALVEQSAAAAGSMQQQAQSLANVVTAFRLDEALHAA